MNSSQAKLLLLLFPLACAAGVAQAPSQAISGLLSGPEIVGRQTLVMTKPPQHTSSGTVADGPILGNGDVGVVIGGTADQLKFYIGKNDFWSQQASPMTVGGINLDIPALQGASYHAEEDILNAEVRGSFATAATTVTTKSWVAATENLLVTELEATGDASVPVTASLFPQGTAIVNNDKPINIGREQHGDGRWYFNGLVDEVYLYDHALDPDEIGQLVDLKAPANGLVRHWGFDAEEGTSAQEPMFKIVTGAHCAGEPPVYRPDELPPPVDPTAGCEVDGYHLDYQRFGIGKIGRAVKLVHSWDYIDAGSVPPLQNVTVAAWIYIYSAGDSNYIVSKGDWNEAYSLSLDQGRLRFSVGDRFVRSYDALPTHTWIQVAGTFDGKQLRAYINGKEVSPPARFIVSGVAGDTVWMSRNADGPLDEQYPWPTPLPPTTTPAVKGREVTVALRVIGAPETESDGVLSFQLKPGTPVYLVAPILSDIDAPNHLAAAEARAQALTAADIATVNDAHRAWWKSFWSESAIQIGDPLIEQYYYTAQYVIASASRTGKVFPGLYGPWVTTDHPSWNGDYTLDYNHETPTLGLYSSNHIATSDPYDPPILELMSRSELYARTMLNDRGVYYPGHMGPWGIERPFDYDPFMGMKSNAAFLVMPMLMRYYSTYDNAYGAEVYPFIREVGDFWQDDLVKVDGKYVILNDCPNEVGPWHDVPQWAACPRDKNPTSELGFLRATFQGLIDMSKELGVDASRRPAWQEILDHLSDYPTAVIDGKPMFLSGETADGKAAPSRLMPGWGTTVIWPANQIGIGEDPKLLEIAQNTINRAGFRDQPLAPPAMARVGYDPVKLLAGLKQDIEQNGYPNGYLYFGGGGVETASLVPGTIDEMLMQSFSGAIRLFPDWPKDQDASFRDLRAYGAFLVTSSYTKSRVGETTIVSEKGRECSLENPWPGQSIVLYRNGKKAETLKGSKVTFHTASGESIVIKPE